MNMPKTLTVCGIQLRRQHTSTRCSRRRRSRDEVSADEAVLRQPPAALRVAFRHASGDCFLVGVMAECVVRHPATSGVRTREMNMSKTTDRYGIPGDAAALIARPSNDGRRLNVTLVFPEGTNPKNPPTEALGAVLFAFNALKESSQ